MNHKVILSYILAICFFILMIYSYLVYNNKNLKRYGDEIKESVIHTIRNDMSSFKEEIKNHTKTSTPQNKEEIKNYVINTIKENGALIVEVVEKYYHNKIEEKTTENIAKLKEELTKENYLTTAGNLEGGLKVIEFLDYECSYCKKNLANKIKLLENFPSLSFIFIELPILGNSLNITKMALAVALIDQQKYFEFQKAALNFKSSPTSQDLINMIKNIGIGEENMNEFLAKQENIQKINDIIAKNMKIAQQMEIRGTPTYIVQGKLVAGALGYEDFAKILNSN